MRLSDELRAAWDLLHKIEKALRDRFPVDHPARRAVRVAKDRVGVACWLVRQEEPPEKG